MNIKLRNVDIRVFAILISFGLSAWHVLLNPIPNADAFDYIRTATVYLDSGLAAAFSWYPSATYPVLIGVLHQLTGIDLVSSGQLLNALFYALIVYAFISISLELRNTRHIALISAAIILTFPTLNEYRYYLIRDIGFLAFMLLAGLQLIRYSKQCQNKNAIAFVSLALIAALFRSEALVYLALAPVALIASAQSRWQAFLKLEALLFAIGILTVAILFMLNINMFSILQRVLTVYWPFLQDAFTALSDGNSALSDAIFGQYAANFSGEYIGLFMLTGLSAVLLAKLLSGLGVPFLLVLLYGLNQHRRELFNNRTRELLGFALISFAIVLCFLALTRFISTRYTLMFSLSLLALVPLIIDSTLIQMHKQQRQKLASGIFIVLFLFSAIDAHISFGGSRDSLQDATDWLLTNTQDGDTVFTNSPYIAYYSGRVENYDEITRYLSEYTIENTQFDTILAITTGSGNDQRIEHSVEFAQIELLAAFPDGEEPEVLIFRRLGN